MKGINNILKASIVFIILIITVIAISFTTLPDNVDEASAEIVSEKVLIPGGHSIGVRMDVKGVLIVGLEELESMDSIQINPGLEAGLEIGDSILEIEGEKVYRASEVVDIVNKSRGNVKIKIKRRDRVINTKITPVYTKDGTYKLGVWVKDKTAGIGTLTFYDPETEKFGALGHGITDPETGTILNVAEGELVNSKVESVKEGKAGNPGEIRGIFYEAEAPLGLLEKNSQYGIFGNSYHSITNPIYTKPIIICTRSQVKKGNAQILTTIRGNNIECFNIEIEKVNLQSKGDTKNLVIKVTDKDLLERTGGIIQGMSGSPIIQNGRIVGAVTHVFVNDPTRGYGIFIENMLENQ